MCVVRDNSDPIVDELLAKFVVGSHLRSHPDFSAAVDEVNVQTSLDQDVRDSASKNTCWNVIADIFEWM